MYINFLRKCLFTIFSIGLSVLWVANISSAQIMLGPLKFILPAVQAKDENREWHEVGRSNKVLINKREMVYNKIGNRHFVLSTDSSIKNEIRMTMENGIRYISLITPIKQGDIQITVSNVQNGILEGDQVPRSMGLDSNGRFRMEVYIQDVTIVKGDGLNKEIPVAYDDDTKASIWWIKEASLDATGFTIQNSTKLYFDEFESFYNEKNCFNSQTKLAPLFKEVFSDKPTKFFYLIKDINGNVVHSYFQVTLKNK